jgi:hypothetical protein
LPDGTCLLASVEPPSAALARLGAIQETQRVLSLADFRRRRRGNSGDAGEHSRVPSVLSNKFGSPIANTPTFLIFSIHLNFWASLLLRASRALGAVQLEPAPLSPSLGSRLTRLSLGQASLGVCFR